MPIDKQVKKMKQDYHIDDQKHWINKELVGIIKYRQQKKVASQFNHNDYIYGCTTSDDLFHWIG